MDGKLALSQTKRYSEALSFDRMAYLSAFYILKNYSSRKNIVEWLRDSLFTPTPVWSYPQGVTQKIIDA